MKKTTKKKQKPVYVAVWRPEATDQVVFLSRSPAGVDSQVYEAIEDGFEDIVGRKPNPENKYGEIRLYFQECSEKGLNEWLMETKEYLT